MEIHCLKPQILLHLNKVPTSIGFKRSIDLTISSKVRLLHSHQINHIKSAGTTKHNYLNSYVLQCDKLTTKVPVTFTVHLEGERG